MQMAHLQAAAHSTVQLGAAGMLAMQLVNASWHHRLPLLRLCDQHKQHVEMLGVRAAAAHGRCHTSQLFKSNLMVRPSQTCV